MYIGFMLETLELPMYIGLFVNDVKYKNSPYYRGSLLWDDRAVETKCCLNIIDYNNSLKEYQIY